MKKEFITMTRDLLAYGLTTSTTVLSSTTLTHVTMSPQVVARFVYGSNGTLSIAGVSTVTGVSQVPPYGMLIPGPADLYLLGSGSSTAAHIHTYLTQGFTGAPTPTP